MSENIIPEKVQEIISDVEETVTDTVEDLSDKTLSELSEIFVSIRNGADSMMRSKEAEAVKSAFYKLLSKIKSENGEENPLNNPLEDVEQNFKAMYADYKKERADFNRRQEEEREANLVKKQAIIDELKSLVEGQEDVSAQFPAFRELQNRW